MDLPMGAHSQPGTHTKQESGHAGWCPDPGLAASRPVELSVCCASPSQSPVFCYGSPSRLRQTRSHLPSASPFLSPTFLFFQLLTTSPQMPSHVLKLFSSLNQSEYSDLHGSQAFTGNLLCTMWKAESYKTSCPPVKQAPLASLVAACGPAHISCDAEFRERSK